MPTVNKTKKKYKLDNEVLHDCLIAPNLSVRPSNVHIMMTYIEINLRVTAKTHILYIPLNSETHFFNVRIVCNAEKW